jgi:hypothetical protein
MTKNAVGEDERFGVTDDRTRHKKATDCGVQQDGECGTDFEEKIDAKRADVNPFTPARIMPGYSLPLGKC